MCYRLANLLLRFALFYFCKYYTRLEENRQPLLEQGKHARCVLVCLCARVDDERMVELAGGCARIIGVGYIVVAILGERAADVIVIACPVSRGIVERIQICAAGGGNAADAGFVCFTAYRHIDSPSIWCKSRIERIA